MGLKFQRWEARTSAQPRNYAEIYSAILQARTFSPLQQLNYGDHGLEAIAAVLSQAILSNQKIALYADYDVDGTMSCVSWIWFFDAIGFKNYVHYIPCRFKEGYGVNLDAVKKLIHEDSVDVIITMDTGITANVEAAYCKANNVLFVCTDHHKIQSEKIPDALILNPKTHVDPIYQELCGCGITFVLLRKLASYFPQLAATPEIWTDLVSLAGMATICDVVPLNPVNHKLANLGVKAIGRSTRRIFQVLRLSAGVQNADEQDFGFRLGPRINAVGRLEHADTVIRAFIEDQPETLVQKMTECNELRKKIQQTITIEATELIQPHAVINFLGHDDWHPGVIGIAASKIVEKTWRPTWLFQTKNGLGKGSARSIFGFDITDAMTQCGELFLKFGGHGAAGGFTFSLENREKIEARLSDYALDHQKAHPEFWKSRVQYDFSLPCELLDLELVHTIEKCKPFGNGFEEPRFAIFGTVEKVTYLLNKQTGEPKHTQVFIQTKKRQALKVMFFNEVLQNILPRQSVTVLTTVQRNVFRGVTSISFFGTDLEVHD